MSEHVNEDGEQVDAQAEVAALDIATTDNAGELLPQEVALPLTPPELPKPAETTGSVLRAARLARGLSIVDVTHAIKFGARQIEALERDDFEKLPGSTFVRGLIRSYGKFLRLEEAPLLALLGRQLAPVESEVHVPEDTGTKISIGGEKRSAVPWMALIVALIAIGVAIATYFEWPLADKAKPAQAPKVQAPSVRIEQAAVSEQNGQAAAQPAASPPAADGKQLIFIFDDKAWVEVKDATQKVIFAQNNPAGTRQLVIGKPPFDLVIGNASKVQVQYEDKMLDLAPHTKVDVARLTLE